MEFWFSEFHTPDVKHSIRVNKQLYSKQSDYQRIDIFETPEFGRVLTLDGNVMLTERDEFIYDEMIVHVPMAVHKQAKDILVIGAGDGGVVRELTRYDRVERIDLVEMDPQVVEACRAFLPSNACRMDDRRVHIYFENALKYIRRCEEEYDLIIVDSSDPFGPSEGLFTREFYGSCFNALKADGIMVNQQGSPFYAEDANAPHQLDGDAGHHRDLRAGDAVQRQLHHRLPPLWRQPALYPQPGALSGAWRCGHGPVFLYRLPFSAQAGLAGVSALSGTAGAGAVQHAAQRLPPLDLVRRLYGAGIGDRQV